MCHFVCSDRAYLRRLQQQKESEIGKQIEDDFNDNA